MNDVFFPISEQHDDKSPNAENITENTTAETPNTAQTQPTEVPQNVISGELPQGSRLTAMPDVSNHPVVLNLIKEQDITSAAILFDDQLVVHTRDRQSAMNILTRGKFTKRTLHFKEQLTKRRQSLMYKLREIRRANPHLKMAVFSRNGAPAVRLGNERHEFMRTEDDVLNFGEFLSSERRLRMSEMRRGVLRPDPSRESLVADDGGVTRAEKIPVTSGEKDDTRTVAPPTALVVNADDDKQVNGKTDEVNK